MNSRLSFALFLGALLLIPRAHASPYGTAGIKGETLVVQVKSNKHKHDSDDDNHHKKKGKNAQNGQSDESASDSDGSKDAKTTTTTPPAATKCNVLWGDYCNPQKQ